MKKQTFSQTKSRKKLLLILVVGLIVLAGAGLTMFYPFASNTKIDYFPHEQSIIYQNELEDNYYVRNINKRSYVPFQFIKDRIDPNILYDEAAKSVIITMPQDVYQMPTEELTYSMNHKDYQLRFPAVKKAGNRTWLSVDWLESVYSINIERHSETGAWFVYQNGFEHQVANLNENVDQHLSKVRQKSTVTSPYYTSLKPGDKIFITGEDESFYQVRTANGYGGYVPKRALEVVSSETIISEKRPEEQLDAVDVDQPFHVTWDAIYSASANPADVEEHPGVNIVSPTWFTLEDRQGGIRNIASKEYVQSAHENGDRVWALFSNDFDPDLTSNVLPSFEKRQRMIRQLLEYAQIYQFDGINIDFENVYKEDGKYLTQLVRELTPLAHKAGLAVSVDVTFISGSGQWSQFYQRSQLAESADYLMVMAYDEHWANSPQAGSVASLPWVENNLQRLLKEVPADQLLLGIPLYTRLWIEETNDKGEVEMSSEALTMNEAKQWIIDRNLTPKFDQASGQNFVSYKEDHKIYRMWLEDQISLNKRVQIVQDYHLAGIASWSQSFANEKAWETIDQGMNQ